MRLSTLLHVLAILLIIAITTLFGFINSTSPSWNLWMLYGGVIILCIGILMIGVQIRVLHLKASPSLAE